MPEKYEANSAIGFFLLATAFCAKKQSVAATNGIILSESLDILKSLKATYPQPYILTLKKSFCLFLVVVENVVPSLHHYTYRSNSAFFGMNTFEHIIFWQ